MDLSKTPLLLPTSLSKTTKIIKVEIELNEKLGCKERNCHLLEDGEGSKKRIKAKVRMPLPIILIINAYRGLWE